MSPLIAPAQGTLLPAAELAVTVFGTPAPQGSKRAYVRDGRAQLVESSAKVKPWREAVKQAALIVLTENMTRAAAKPLDGPLAIEVTFTLSKPTNRPKTRRSWPDRKPDLDKLLRSTFDALSDAGAWADDARVVEVVARKAFPGEHPHALHIPGARITIRQVTA